MPKAPEWAWVDITENEHKQPHSPFGFTPLEFDVMRDSLWKRRARIIEGHTRVFLRNPNDPNLPGLRRELETIDTLINRFGLHYPKDT